MPDPSVSQARMAALDRYRHDLQCAYASVGSEDDAVVALRELRSARVGMTLPQVLAVDMTVGRGLAVSELARIGAAEDTAAHLIVEAALHLARHYARHNAEPREFRLEQAPEVTAEVSTREEDRNFASARTRFEQADTGTRMLWRDPVLHPLEARR